MKKSVLGALLVLMFVAVGIAAAPPLTFTFSDVHANKTATETDSFAVNNAGAIAGDFVDVKGIQHAMILAGKKLTSVNHPNCTNTGGFSAGAIAFYGINSAGAAAGWCTSTKTGQYTAFVYSAGKFTAINFPKSLGTQAMGINDKGDVVGFYLDSSGVQHAYVKKGAKYTSFDISGGTTTEAWESTTAARSPSLPLPQLAATKASSTTARPSRKSATPRRHNRSRLPVRKQQNDVAGAYFDSSGFEVGFLLHGGKYYDLKDPKANNNTRPDGLNDTLEIVGRYTPTSGANVGFKAITKAAAGDTFVSTVDTGEERETDQRVAWQQPLNTP